MAKGYWIAHVEVSDMAAYRKYIEANAKPFAEFGARFLVRAGECEIPEGSLRPRTVILEFPSYRAALDCYHSPGYQVAKDLRLAASRSDIVIIDGYDGPQPGD